MSRSKPVASVSIDLDNQWSYMKTHGNPDWQTLPSYLDLAVPRFLSFFRRHGLRSTFFVVGLDAAQPRNAAVLSAIAANGHEVGNHSFHHEPWLHLYSEEEVDREIGDAERAIEAATGARPIGFRGPGYSLSESVLRTLIARGYVYDASTLPTFIGPLARTYYFLTANLTPEEKARRRKLFGGVRDGLRPLKPYTWRVGTERILEIPVTTMPGLRVPIHLSYILYMARYSRSASLAYFRGALLACRAAGIEPSLLLHPLDLIGCGEAPPLDFFPAMRMPAEVKDRLMNDAFDMLTRHFDVVPMGEHARRILDRRAATRTELRWEAS